MTKTLWWVWLVVSSVMTTTTRATKGVVRQHNDIPQEESIKRRARSGAEDGKRPPPTGPPIKCQQAANSEFGDRRQPPQRPPGISSSSSEMGGFSDGFGGSSNGGAPPPQVDDDDDSFYPDDSNGGGGSLGGFGDVASGGGGGGGSGGNPNRPKPWECGDDEDDEGPTVSPVPFVGVGDFPTLEPAPFHPTAPTAPAAPTDFTMGFPPAGAPRDAPVEAIIAAAPPHEPFEYVVSLALGGGKGGDSIQTEVGTVMTQIINDTTPYLGRVSFRQRHRRQEEEQAQQGVILMYNSTQSHAQNVSTTLSGDATWWRFFISYNVILSNETASTNVLDNSNSTTVTAMAAMPLSHEEDGDHNNVNLTIVDEIVWKAVNDSIASGLCLQRLKEHSVDVFAVVEPGEEMLELPPTVGAFGPGSSSYHDLDTSDFDIRQWIGLGLFFCTLLLTLSLVKTAKTRRRQLQDEQHWGVRLNTEHDINDLLTYGWQQDGQQLTIFDKDKFGYLDDDSMLIGGMHQMAGRGEMMTNPSSGDTTTTSA